MVGRVWGIGVSSQDSKPARAIPRVSKLNTIGSLLAGLAILVAGAAFIEPDPLIDRHVVSVIGLSVSSQAVAAAIIVIAMTIIGLNLRTALRRLRPGQDVVAVLEGAVPLDTFGGRRVRPDIPARSLPTETDSSSLVAFGLLEPEPALSSPEMDLLAAIRRAFRESQTTKAASFATAVANHPDDIIKMYATFIAEYVPIYGCRSPSGSAERILMGDPMKEFWIEDGSLALRERNGSGTYRNLTIKTDDFRVVVAQLAAPAFH